MSKYSVEDLARRGAPFTFATIVQQVREGGEPFVTYGSIARLLEQRLRIPKIFSVHIGHVAGTMMDAIEAEDNKAPPINALVTEPNGIPGVGFGGYYNRLWRRDGGSTWDALDQKRKLEVIEEIRSAVRKYPKWDQIYRAIYRTKPPRVLKKKRFTERDGKPPETTRKPGLGESPEHRRLKHWAANNPAKLGLSRAVKGTPEQDLLSGDRVDVQFSDGRSFVVVEVKSILSSDDDFRRGIYQCVKYRAVVEAQEHPAAIPVRALLLTERALPNELLARARLLGVTVITHKINQRAQRQVQSKRSRNR